MQPADAAMLESLAAQRERWLADARGIIADAAHHRLTLLRLALAVVVRHSPEAAERSEAAEFYRLLA